MLTLYYKASESTWRYCGSFRAQGNGKRDTLYKAILLVEGNDK